MESTLFSSGSSSLSVKRFMKRRRYKRLHERSNGGGKSFRLVKLGGHKKRQAGWNLRILPKINLRKGKAEEKVSAKSWLGKMRDGYVKMLLGLSQSRIKENPKKMGVEDFNNKMAVEIYRSLGIQVEPVLASRTSTRSLSRVNLGAIMF